ncbi:MAG: carbohydrate kinase [Myxococcales bacterium]|nr:carbohydrate kinase [Myxococcales bacterium]
MQERNIGSVLCWGEVLWDLFPSGACLGGAPSNLAVHLAASGLPTALVSRVGTDSLGKQAREALQLRGLDTRALQEDGELATGRVGVKLCDGEARYTLHSGAWQRIVCDDIAAELLSITPAFCFGTLSQESDTGLSSWRQALTHLPESAIRFCDPNLRGGRIDPAQAFEHIEAATIVKLNEKEAETFESTYGCDNAVSWLLEEMNVALVAKTLGPHGSQLTTRAETAHHPGFPATSGGDNIGAGDAFGAILVRGALAKAPLANIAEAANLYGSFVASNRGATPHPSVPLLKNVAQLLGLG